MVFIGQMTKSTASMHWRKPVGRGSRTRSVPNSVNPWETAMSWTCHSMNMIQMPPSNRGNGNIVTDCWRCDRLSLCMQMKRGRQPKLRPQGHVLTATASCVGSGSGLWARFDDAIKLCVVGSVVELPEFDVTVSAGVVVLAVTAHDVRPSTVTIK